MSTVEEHFAILRAMGPRQGGWLTDPFHLAAARFLGAHLDELEDAWTRAKALGREAASPLGGPILTLEEQESASSNATLPRTLPGAHTNAEPAAEGEP